MKNIKLLGVIVFAFMVSCKAVRLRNCNMLNRNESEQLEQRIKENITAFYSNSGSQELLQKVIKAQCVNDTLVEIQTLSNQDVTSYFLFDFSGTMVSVRHELPSLGNVP